MDANPAQLATLVVGAGFVIALAFGYVAASANFCTMGALADIVNLGHWGRMRMWLLAVAVAIAGTTLLSLAGLVDLSRSVAQRPNLPWLSLLVGGALFGVGMTLAGGCPNKNLLRVGGGSLRALVVLSFVAIASAMTLKGLFGHWRARWLDPQRIDLGELGWPDQGLGSALARLTGLAPKAALAVAATLVVLALLAFAFADRRFRANRRQVAAGALLGLLVVAGWYVTGHLGFGENPETLEFTSFGTNSRSLESLSFVAPLAYTLELLTLWTDASLRPTFGVAAVVGVVAGSLLHALVHRQFRWEGFASVQDLRTQLGGAVLMGFGGVTALGCSIGQGLSGVSTLALGSFVAVGAIVAGSVATLHWIVWRTERED